MMHFFAYRSLAKNANFREKNKCKNMIKYKFWCWALTVKNSSSFLLLLQHLWFSWNFYLSDVSRKSFAKYDQESFAFFRKIFCVLETLVMIGHPNNIFKVVANTKPWEILFLKTRQRRLCLSFYVSGIFLFHLAGWMDG